MQLSVSEAAHVLNVSEDVIYQWIRNGHLPAVRFGSRHRINRAKLLEWAYGKRIAVEVHGSVEEPILERAIKHGRLDGSVEVENVAQLLAEAISNLSVPRSFKTEEFFKYLELRENYGVVAGHSQIAVPHTGSPVVLPLPEAVVEIAYLNKPVLIGTAPCSIVMLSFVRSTPEHLNLLTRILFALSDQRFVSLLQHRADKETLLGRLRELSVIDPPSKN